MTKCNGAHCKCMNLGGTCPNHHYATCKEHNPQLADDKPPMRSSEITKENLRVGDVIVSNWKGLRAKVLEILDHSFAVSNFGTTEHDWRFGFEWIRFSDARDSGYEIEIIKE